MSTQYLAQYRRSPSGPWITVGDGSDAARVAHTLDTPMQQHGLRFSELHAHRKDLVDGHILTAEDGAEFRIVQADQEADK